MVRVTHGSRLLMLGAVFAAMACGGTEGNDTSTEEGVVALARGPLVQPLFTWLGYVPAPNNNNEAQISISDASGNHPPSGMVRFDTCVGRGKNGAHLVSAECASGGRGTWVSLGGNITYDPNTGIATALYGPGVLSLRCSYSGRGSGFASGTSDPIDTANLTPLP